MKRLRIVKENYIITEFCAVIPPDCNTDIIKIGTTKVFTLGTAKYPLKIYLVNLGT